MLHNQDLKSMRKSFMFYLSWKSQVDILNDKELRRFVNNLICYHQGDEVDLKSKSDKLVWNGILPALEVNDSKYNSRVESSRENGKLGGRPKKELKTQETQQVFEKPKEPDNREEEIVNGKKGNENGQLKNDNGERKIENGQLKNENKKESIVEVGQSVSSYLKSRIEEFEVQLILKFPQYPYLLDMANPSGIKEVKHHVEPEELEEILSILKELAESKFKLWGKYD